jgi:spoIIIJ-associated protein
MDTLTTIKQIIADLLRRMDFEAKIEVDTTNQNDIFVNIQTNEAGFLIGQGGANLQAFQHLARVLVSKKLGSPIRFILDVNHYQKHRIELLKELANNIANQALRDKASLFLQPMSAYERRIIHLALANHPQVDTKSTGQEPKRRVVIRPKM